MAPRLRGGRRSAGEFLGSTGRDDYPLSPRIDNEAGSVRFGAYTVGNEPGAAGSGPLAEIVFEIQECDAMSDVTINDVTITFKDGTPEEVGQVLDGTIEIECGVSSVPSAMPHGATLFASRPNPLTSVTEISFYLPQSEPVSVDLAIFDAAGRLVRTLVNGDLAAGTHVVAWNARDRSGNVVPNGAYFSRLVVDGKAFREQIVVAR